MASSTVLACRSALIAPIDAVSATGAGPRRHDVIANAGEKSLGCDMHVVDRAILQDQSELVAREAADHIAAAQPRPNPRCDFENDLIRDLIAKGIVDLCETVDPDQHEGEG